MKKSAAFALVPIAILAGSGIGFFGRDLTSGDFSFSSATKLSSKSGTELTPAEVFLEAYQDIRNNYNQKVLVDDLKNAAMSGAVAALGDPHTVYMEPEFAADFLKDTRGQNSYAGIGARLQDDPAGARIVSVFSGSPAEEAGVEPGDIIKQVDGVDAAGTSVDQIVTRIKGPEGSRVKVQLLRPSTGKLVMATILRKRIATPSVDYVYFDKEQVGYLMVFSFAENTPIQFANALDQLTKKGMKGLVIDMRGNPGGLLESARMMLSQFTSNKLVVRTVGRDPGKEESVYTYPDYEREVNYKIAVLQNEGSASASEIFAGVMRDYKLAKIFGEHTYGKSSVQQMYGMNNRAAVKVTVAKYFLPSNTDIMRKLDENGQYLSGGLKPDVEVKLGLGPNTVMGHPEKDNQLKSAIDYVLSRPAKG
jgi:carboxyl-terminal processing protease